MTNMEDAIWFAVSVITMLAFDTDNTVADTAEQLGAENIADIPRVMPCFAVWSEKVERDARAYADNFSYGWATGFCETARLYVCIDSDLSGYTLGGKPLDREVLHEFVEIVRGTIR